MSKQYRSAGKDKAGKYMTLSEDVKQPFYRYASLVDALGDLGDCLSMVHLFAALPTSQYGKDSVSRIDNCRRLSHEWQAYIARTHKLRKTYILAKAICFQAEVQGKKITWVTPRALQPILTDFDFNVMLKYLEFDEMLLTHVNLHLYHSINVKYPPIPDPRLEASIASLADLYGLSRLVSCKAGASSNMLEQDQTALESQLTLAQLQHQPVSREPVTLIQLGTLMQLVQETEEVDDEGDETKEYKSLFAGLKFFLSREVPREAVLFVITAFGGIVSWEGSGSPFDETDQSITHQIVDRPTQDHIYLSREYIQPQWVFDCVNALVILPTKDYLVGKICPPQFSPFVDYDAVGSAERIKQLQAAGRRQVMPLPDIGTDVDNDTHDVLAKGVNDRMEVKEAAERKQEIRSFLAEKIKQLRAAGRRQVMPLPDIGTDVDDETHDVSAESVNDRMEAKEAAERKQEYQDALETELKRSNKTSAIPKLVSTGPTDNKPDMVISNKRKHEEVDVVEDRKRRIAKCQASRKH